MSYDIIDRLSDHSDTAGCLDSTQLRELQFGWLAARAFNFYCDKPARDHGQDVGHSAFVCCHDFACPALWQRGQVVGDFFLDGRLKHKRF